MISTEPPSLATPDSYLALFHRYITRSINALYVEIERHIERDLDDLSNDTREQAWHLLDYGLKLAHGWESVRPLLLALAPRMERAGFRHEWLPYLERGVASSRRADDLTAEAELALHIGRLHRLAANFAAANQWLETSAELYRQLQNNAMCAQALNQLAYVARLQSQFDRAKHYVDEAISLLDENDVETAGSHWALGTVAVAQHQWDEAEKHLRAARRIWRDAGDRQREAWALQNIGNALRGAGRHAEAVPYIQQAIVLLGQLRDPVNQAIARMSLGIIHIYDQDPAQALALFQLAEPVFRRVGDSLHLAMVYTNITIVERDLGHYEASVQAGKRALQNAQTIGDLKIAANASDELGLTYVAMKRTVEAVAAFEQGLDLLAHAPADAFQKMVHDSLQSHLREVKASVGSSADAR